MKIDNKYEFHKLFEEENPLDSLIGRRIESLFLHPEGRFLLINTDGGLFKYNAIGDCCAECYFSEISGVEALIGYKILSVELIPKITTCGEPSEDFFGDRNIVCDLMGIKIVTCGGYAELYFRNYSNGYYSGWLEKELEGKYILKTIYDLKELVSITEDWSFGDRIK